MPPRPRSLQLVPSHDDSAGRPFPLAVMGRCELAKWWWHSCPCHDNPNKCVNCKRLAQHIKSLSKRMFAINDENILTMSRKQKNIDLLWFNQEHITGTKQHGIQLQPNDTLSIGKSPESPWMEFIVRKVVNSVVTPETTTNAVSNNKTQPKKRRRLLFSRFQDDPFRINESSMDSIPFKPKKKRKRLYYSGNEANEDEQEPRRPVASRRRLFSSYPRAPKKKPQQLSFSDSSSSSSENEQEDSPDTKKQVTIGDKEDTAKRQHDETDTSSSAARPRLLATQEEEEDSLPSASTKEQAVTSEPVRRGAEEQLGSVESSVLSLPQCSTWEEDDEEEDHGQVTPSNKLQAQKPASRKDPAEASSTVEGGEAHESHSPVLASAIPISLWKQWRSRTNKTCGVRKALADLVVTQRATTTRGDDDNNNWLPALLEGAVVVEQAELLSTKQTKR